MTSNIEKKDFSFEKASLDEIKEYLNGLLNEIENSGDFKMKEKLNDLRNEIDVSNSKVELERIYNKIEELRKKETTEAVDTFKKGLEELKKDITIGTVKAKLEEKETIIFNAEKGRSLAQKKSYIILNESKEFYVKFPLVGKFIKWILDKAS